MQNRLVTLVSSALVLIGATSLAHSDSLGRYECNIVGVGTPEPIGDRNGQHAGCPMIDVP